MRSPITVHILDTTAGVPAAGIPVVLEQERGGSWVNVSSVVTDVGGRADMMKLEEFTPSVDNPNCCFKETIEYGVYRLQYQTADYIKSSTGKTSFFPYLSIPFQVQQSEANQYFHIPVLLNPAGFTGYRGS
eukprot:CAMPEP_0175095826 /NCGR_PEP_ID=MMETSP0086_2-20121207/4385_1 /TAXON_ID=136419 /ORGANISM="Unknown Unknown, Strain D1" /LENGTH=130 /DNA_ID=CAMNT_0016369145 /DNA_START=81 /DNA_END=473 /DNA_ORIENTATION=+